MSSRKGTGVVGCKGYVSRLPFNGDWVTRFCSECGYHNTKQCEEFRRSVKFTKIRISISR